MADTVWNCVWNFRTHLTTIPKAESVQTYSWRNPIPDYIPEITDPIWTPGVLYLLSQIHGRYCLKSKQHLTTFAPPTTAERVQKCTRRPLFRPLAQKVLVLSEPRLAYKFTRTHTHTHTHWHNLTNYSCIDCMPVLHIIYIHITYII